MNRKNIQIRDPFIYREDGEYYMLGTTGPDPGGKGSDLSLYVSRDLSEFEFVKRLADPRLFEGYKQLWAPELHYYRGRYYLILSVYREDKGRGSIILTSDQLDKDFVFLTGEYITPANWTCLDATLFVYGDEPYLCFSNEWIDAVGGDGDGSLFLAKLSPDLKYIEGKPIKIVSGKECGLATALPMAGGEGWVAEGPYLITEGKKIYLYWSTFTEKGYCVIRNVADSIFGEYKFDRYIYLNDGGHSMVFTDNDNHRKLLFHQPNKTPLERAFILDLDTVVK